MSFSKEVKEELTKQVSKSLHCRLAEIGAILAFSGRISGSGEKQSLVLDTENLSLAQKYHILLDTTFGISVTMETKKPNGSQKGKNYIISVKEQTQIFRILSAIKWLDEQGVCCRKTGLVNGLLVQSTCCKRAFIRGAFLSAGSMSDPEKSYHFEIVCQDLKKAEQLQEMINDFSLDSKIVQRKRSFVVYLKEGEQIVDLLNIMEAHVSLMNLENVRILKEMRNSINRQVNCETANLSKTVNAAVRQKEDILYIEQVVGLHTLTKGLRELAELRLKYPEAPLKELGTMMDPPVGKSGVNHRLRKISSIAEELREK